VLAVMIALKNWSVVLANGDKKEQEAKQKN
jgi:hypothetical protein